MNPHFHHITAVHKGQNSFFSDRSSDLEEEENASAFFDLHRLEDFCGNRRRPTGLFLNPSGFFEPQQKNLR
jgi:hypothetical protein